MGCFRITQQPVVIGNPTVPVIDVRHRYHWIFYIALYLSYVGVLFVFAGISDIDSASHTAIRLVLGAVEIGLFSLAGLFLLKRWLTFRTFGWWLLYLLLAATVGLTYVAQMYSVWLSNNFISVVALQNAGDVRLTMSPWAVLAVLVGLAWVVVLGLCAWRDAVATRGDMRRLQSGKWTVAMLALAATLWIGAISQEHRRASLEPGFRQTPLASLLVNAWEARMGPADPPGEPFTRSSQTCFRDFGSNNVPGYPFQKSMVYRDALPFAKTTGAIPNRPNVILFFTEGESAQLIGAYGGHYPGLTPNIDKLAARSMRVTDYYNHTAATYQGIIGQTSSGFSNSGEAAWGSDDGAARLAAIKRQTLAAILDHKGYGTYFFTSHPAGAFTNMVDSLGFEHVYGRDEISLLLQGHIREQYRTDQLDDESLFRGLTTFLETRSSARDPNPFFIATYNIGTHAFLPVAIDGLKYGNGESEPLNKLHNYDAALGSFLDWFYASPYAKNTIIVFTTDHATYPDRTYRAVAGAGLKPYFVDKIPLLILDPTHQLPAELDAKGRNSLDLAPTVLQLLGIQRLPNSFLGHSLFEPRSFSLGVTAIGSSFFITTDTALYPLADVPASLTATADCERDVVNAYYAAEHSNHIFDPPPGWRIATHNLAYTHQHCALDAVNGAYVAANAAATVKKGEQATISGWFADNDKRPLKAFTVSLQGKAEFGFAASDTMRRQDVAKSIGGSGDDNYGYKVSADLADVEPGSYMVNLVAPDGSTCYTGKRVIIEK